MKTLKEFEKAYNDMLQQQPLLTNATQGAIITALGVIASQFIGGSNRLELKEIIVMSFLNFIYITPMCMMFFGLLDKVRGGIFAQLLVDQFAFSPVFNFTILSLRLLLRRETAIAEIPVIVAHELPKTMMYAWLFWIPFRAYAMNYAPPKLMLLFNCGGAFVWTIIFAMVLS